MGGFLSLDELFGIIVLCVRPYRGGHALQGTNTGPRTSEGLECIRKARTTHGRRTAEMDRMRAMVRVPMAGAKRLVERR
jgi:hypothetical protein